MCAQLFGCGGFLCLFGGISKLHRVDCFYGMHFTSQEATLYISIQTIVYGSASLQCTHALELHVCVSISLFCNYAIYSFSFLLGTRYLRANYSVFRVYRTTVQDYISMTSVYKTTVYRTTVRGQQWTGLQFTVHHLTGLQLTGIEENADQCITSCLRDWSVFFSNSAVTSVLWYQNVALLPKSYLLHLFND